VCIGMMDLLGCGRTGGSHGNRNGHCEISASVKKWKGSLCAVKKHGT
jgi:hypothetical protein